MVEQQPKLFEYGIQLEQSDVRVHVSPATRRLYVFPTGRAQDMLNARAKEFREATATQPGVAYATARGFLIPWKQIPELRIVDLSHKTWWDRFAYHANTSHKSACAVQVVQCALEHGYLPLWFKAAAETEHVTLQIKGADIVLFARTVIQVKCDWSAGPVEFGGTGNIFFQTAELNPLRRH